MRNCEWFKCRAEFGSARADQRFCSGACRAAEKNWRAMRGGPIVPLLMDWRRSRNWTAEKRSAYEARNNRPVPGITEIARLVDDLIAEQRLGDSP